MPSTSDIYSQLTGAMGRLNDYNPGSQQDFTNGLNSRVGNFANQHKDLGNMDAGLYSAPATQMSGFYQKYGTGANSGIDPMQSLALLTQRIGSMQGNRDAYANTINQAGGKINDLATGALQSYNAGRQGLTDNIGYLQNLYGTSNSNDQAEKSRQAQIQAANISAGASLRAAELAHPAFDVNSAIAYLKQLYPGLDNFINNSGKTPSVAGTTGLSLAEQNKLGYKDSLSSLYKPSIWQNPGGFTPLA